MSAIDLSPREFPATETDIPEKLQQRYTYWKKNARLLYDYLNTNTAKWPSLSCQFMPDLDTTTDKHRLLLTSFTSGQLDEDEAVYISELSTAKHIPWSSLNNFDMDEMEFKVDNGINLPTKKLVQTMYIQFPNGDCNRARYMPQNPDVIGCISSQGPTYIFDRTKHGSTRPTLLGKKPKYEIAMSRDISGLGDNFDEPTSLAWNIQKEGTLAVISDGGDLCIWDITQYKKQEPYLRNPTAISNIDSSGLNDVSWMVHHSSILAACGEGNVLCLYDTRTPSTDNAANVAHSGGINTVQFNQENDLLLCSGDSMGTMHLWDIRDLKKPLVTWSHSGSISTMQWNPAHPTVVASAGQEDGLVKIWDVSKNTPLLLFTHGGHMLGVNDISWNLHDTWTMCSVSNDNSIHIWKPAANLVAPKP